MSEVFKMPGGKFMTALVLSKLLPWVAVSALVVVLSIIPAILLDIRWILLPLMLLLIVAPGVLLMLYIWYGTLPGYYQNVAPHIVERTETHLILRSVWKGGTEDYTECKVRSHRIPKEDLQPPQVLVGGELWLYKNGKGFVWIPINY